MTERYGTDRYLRGSPKTFLENMQLAGMFVGLSAFVFLGLAIVSPLILVGRLTAYKRWQDRRRGELLDLVQHHG